MREITFYNPSRSFPALSVTGERCALDCAHCRKKFLHSMIPTTTPESMVQTCRLLWRGGAQGVLVSGGCDGEGRVPLFYEALREVRDTTGLILNVHPGIVDETNLEALERAHPHCVSLDIPTDHALREIHRLERKSEEYVASLVLMRERNLNVVPHVCLGMNESPDEETRILKTVSEVSGRVVLNILFPASGTEYAGKEIDEERVVGVFRYGRPLFKRMTLGCMRPRKRRIEEGALVLDGIVSPTRWARKKADEEGLRVLEKNTCCVID